MTETSHLGEKFSQLENAKQIPEISVPKIQRVAHYLREREKFTKYYSPKLLSIGPIHWGEENLKLGEKYKLMWAASYLERTKLDAKTMYQKIASNIKQLKELFAEDVIRDSLDDEKLSWMLFVDGCSLLQILEKGKFEYPEMHVKADQLVLVWHDVLLLENQLPYQVLKLLSGHENDAQILKIMKEFLKCHHLSPNRPDQSGKKKDKREVNARDEDSALAEPEGEHKIEIPPEESPVHLLDQLRRTALHDPNKKHKGDKNKGIIKNKKKKNSRMITYRNIQELKEAGIQVKRSSRRLGDISFSSRWFYAELRLPEIIVDETTAPTFLNLVAYEMCPDFENNYEICSFVDFMDSLIDSPGDVKELRSAGILQNVLGSDKEVAKLFNTISNDLVSNMEGYSHVKPKIMKHYKNTCKTWIALGYHTYFSNPWAIIGFHAAVFALVLTFIQTWYAIHPNPTN